MHPFHTGPARIALALTGALVGLVATSVQAGPLDLGGHEIVDLSHGYGPETLYWPTAPSGFELESLADGLTAGGYYYAANRFRTPEHGGTHVDAPRHFALARNTVDQIPLSRLIGQGVVIDISARAAGDPDTLLGVADVAAFEKQHGRIPKGSIVLLRTGWSGRWPDAKRYLGDDTPGDASNLHFPSFGPEAVALLLLERGVTAIGVDTASIDGGRSSDFPVHRIAAGANAPGLENLTNLDRLPPVGATVVALPMKIEGGSGAPVRVIAILPSRD